MRNRQDRTITCTLIFAENANFLYVSFPHMIPVDKTDFSRKPDIIVLNTTKILHNMRLSLCECQDCLAHG